LDVESNSPLRLLWNLDTPIGDWGIEVEMRGMIDSKGALRERERERERERGVRPTTCSS
jgi:hypothetical protein